MERSHLLAAACSAILVTTAAASAADLAPPRAWNVTLGAGAVYAPRFDGAKKHRIVALPSFDVVWKDTIFVSTRDGVGVNFINNDLVKAGPIFKYNMGRRRADDRDALAGLDNVSGTVEGGGFFKYTPLPFLDASLEVRQGLGGHRGAVAELASNVSAPPLLSEKLFLSIGPRINFADKNFNEAFYGITAAEAARSTYARYTPKAGLRSYGLGAAARYEVTDQIGLGLFAEYSRLTGPAADSPIVRGRDGSKTQSVFGMALTYSFN